MRPQVECTYTHTTHTQHTHNTHTHQTHKHTHQTHTRPHTHTCAHTYACTPMVISNFGHREHGRPEGEKSHSTLSGHGTIPSFRLLCASPMARLHMQTPPPLPTACWHIHKVLREKPLRDQPQHKVVRPITLRSRSTASSTPTAAARTNPNTADCTALENHSFLHPQSSRGQITPCHSRT